MTPTEAVVSWGKSRDQDLSDVRVNTIYIYLFILFCPPLFPSQKMLAEFVGSASLGVALTLQDMALLKYHRCCSH